MTLQLAEYQVDDLARFYVNSVRRVHQDQVSKQFPMIVCEHSDQIVFFRLVGIDCVRMAVAVFVVER